MARPVTERQSIETESIPRPKRARGILFPVVAVLAIAVAALDVAWTIYQFGGETAATWWSDLVAIPIPLSFTLVAWLVSTRRKGRARVGWILLGAGALAWAIGESIWSYYELILEEDPFPSLADAGFLALIPFVIVGLLLFPAAPRRLSAAARAVLDGLIIVGSLLFISWGFLLRDFFAGGDDDLLGTTIAAAYPIGDVVLVSIVLFVVSRTPRGNRLPLALIGLGIIALGAADSGFWYLDLRDAFTSTSLINPLWDIGFLLMTLGAVAAMRMRSPDPDSVVALSPGRFAMLLPYLPVIPVILLSGYWYGTGRLDRFLFWAMLSVLLLVVGRQLLTLLENISLTRDLETRVRELIRANAELIEGVNDYAIFALDPQGFVRTWNTGAERIKGYAASEIIGRHFSCFYPPGDRDAGMPAADLRLALLEGRAEQEGWRVRTDGTMFFANVVITPLRDDSGVLRGFSNVTRDITERVRAEQEREELESQLNHSRRLESLGQLAGGVAHDFNNILAVILGFAGVVKDQVNAQVVAVPEETRTEIVDHLEQIRRAAERAAALTKQLLTFSRRDAVRPEIVDMNDSIRDIEMLLRRTLGDNIRLDLDLAPELWKIKADPGQLDQVLANLAVNARDAMPNGGALTIRTSNEPLDDFDAQASPGLAAGRYVRIRVSDTGVGMEEDVAARAFDPFFTTKPKGAGTGLGLATVYGIVRQSGGSITIRSAPGRGTTFTIHFPVTEETERAPEKPASRVSLDPRGETVLVVEDDPAVRQLAVRILSQHGYAVIESGDPLEAFDLYKMNADRIDLVLTDVVMPHLSGPELITRIKTIRADLPAVCMSGYAEPVANMEKLGETATFLPKPFTKEQLLSAVRLTLDARAPRGADDPRA